MEPHDLDVRGKPCPLPIVEAAKAMLALPPGALLRLRGTDPAIPKDLEAWCGATGHVLERVELHPAEILAWVRKAPSSLER